MKKLLSKENLNHFRTYLANILLPCLVFGTVTGALGGAVVFGFLRLASLMSSLFSRIQGAVLADMRWLPLFFAGLVLCAAVASWLLGRCSTAKGGGIPIAIGFLRGTLSFSWLPTLICTVASAMMSYLCGMPLGSEGPCVQIGTAIGRGVGRVAGEKHRAWDRYIMTGGACAGFAAATFSPVTGVFFALEEAHKRFSPMILMMAFSGVTSSMIVTEVLSAAFGVSTEFLPLPEYTVPNHSLVWIAFAIGVGGAVVAALFGFLYKAVHEVVTGLLSRVPLFVRVAAVFVAVGAVGLWVPEVTGSGHSLIETVFAHPYALSIGALLLILALRIVLILLANNAGVTGGLFIPTLTVGALYGILAARLCVALGVDGDYCSFLVLLGMVSFFAAVNRIPITALVFAMEQLHGAQGILFLCAAVFTSYLVMELLRVPALCDVVLEKRIKEVPPEGEYVDTKVTVTVKEDSFVVGKAVRDIFWPAGCRVLDVLPRDGGTFSDSINDGDRLRLRIRTSRAAAAEQELCALIGDQKILP